MPFDNDALAKALELLVLGWGGVFIVLGLIYAASVALCRLFPPRKGE
ncbi:OadG-related small transporter subunit [uncultured Parolsenella sp.]|nr:OadG-related small transporter subunit [uncultured Parolsenella sp.]